MISRSTFPPAAEMLYRKRKGILVLRDCVVGHIPPSHHARIFGRRVLRRLRVVKPWLHHIHF